MSGTTTRAASRVALWAALAAGLACLTCGAKAEAHEIGTTQVTAHLDVTGPKAGGTYTVVVVTDAESLLEKLETMADRPGLPGPKPAVAEIPGRLAALERIFRDRVAVRFDGSAVHPDIDFRVAPPKDDVSPPVATILLTGAVPAGVTRFAWSYAWTFASYGLRIVEGHVDDVPQRRSDRGPGRPSERRLVDAASGSAETEWLEGGQASTPYVIGTAPPRVSRASIAWQYMWLGITHIVPKGLDHVLFVLGLFLLTRRWRSVLWQVSAFTVAHSVTLGLGMYGIVEAPASVVEPLIALSIAYVAVENVFLSELKASRIALVFACGLLHGLGFAGVLTELGLPRGEFLTALVGFNVGVEAGQLIVIATAFALVGWSQAYPSYRRRVVVPASLAIACAAFYWTVERWPL